MISLAVLRHVDADTTSGPPTSSSPRPVGAAATRRPEAAVEPPDGEEAVDEVAEDVALPPERVAELEAAEEMLLTVTDLGFGKRAAPMNTA